MNEHMMIDRRRFLILTGGLAAGSQLLPSWPERANAADVDPAPFPLGVASGDPDDRSVVLWTRLANDPLVPGGGLPANPVTVGWEVAVDPGFSQVLASGSVVARPEDAHSVHVTPGGLPPDSWFHYRFHALGATSRTGRTRTMPAAGSVPARFRLAVASCQAWAGGPYPAYRDLAEHDVDLVLHLGDYIYETSTGSLDEFRRLHGLYKTSAQLREAHARAPFVTTWDDHEVQNNYAAAIPGNAGDGRPFLERRANAYRAYYEHLPLRPAQRPSGPDLLLYRRLTVGRLLELSVLDTRQYRGDQPCGDDIKPACDTLDDPARTMTGPVQERWLIDGLHQSQARWNVVAQQTIMAPFDYDLGPGRTYNMDQWDGYPAARQRLLDSFTGVTNPVVLSGDWHSHWVNDLHADARNPASAVIGTEFTGTSISSGIGWDSAVRQGLAANPHVKLYNGTYRGYLLCEVTPDSWRTDLRIVTDPRVATAPAYTLAAFGVADGTPGAVRLDEGDSLIGRVSGDGAGLPNAQIDARRPDGSLAVTTTTDADGNYLSFLPPGVYDVSMTAVGYEPQARRVTIGQTGGGVVSFACTRSGVFARTGRLVPGPNREATGTDLVIGNAHISLAVAVTFADGQLPGATAGKPVDLAGLGHLDQLDWINLGYVATAQPVGVSAWQAGLVRSTAVRVTGPSTILATGSAIALPAIAVSTEYTVAEDDRWVTAVSTFTNTGTTARVLWVGDAMDHDGTGQRSGVPGTGAITTPYESPAAYQPAAPWIGATGTDRQTYALMYDEPSFDAYGNGNWIMSRRRITLGPGGSYWLRRRLVAIDSGPGADPFAVLEGL